MSGSAIKLKQISLRSHGEEEEEEDLSKAIVEVKVKLEEEEDEEDKKPLVTFMNHKRKRKSVRIAELIESSGLDDSHKNKQPRVNTTRWNNERIKFAEQTLAEVLKEKGATFEKPVSRFELRTTARKKIGDTGLLDHSLKHFDGKVTPGGAHRFRRCYNTNGTMQFWLESADLVKIKRESGIPDPNWVPPSWWICETASHESSKASTKLLMEEVEKMKSDIKELVSKQTLPEHGDASEELFKELISWRVKTDKQISEISNSLTSTQAMFKDLASWKDRVEQQLLGISNSLNNLQANNNNNGSNSFSPAPDSWEHILQNANLDDFTGNGLEPWDDFIDVMPHAVRPDTYPVPPYPFKSSFRNQHHVLFEEQSLLNVEMQRTESCLTRGDSRSSNQDKAEMTPGSSMTACQRSDMDDPNVHPQETLKELVTWKAKAEQQLTEISNAVTALQGKIQPNPHYR